MICFRSNKDNHEYLTWLIRIDGAQLMMGDILPTYVQNEVEKMYFSSFDYPKKLNEKSRSKEIISEISFRKDSLLGSWLLTHYDQKKIIYEDEYIYYKKVTNALNIAMFEGDPIADKIMPLFKNKIKGPKHELINKYDEEVIDYILTHDDFEALVSDEEKEATEYIVFEDGEYSTRTLSKDNKVIVKKDKKKK